MKVSNLEPAVKTCIIDLESIKKMANPVQHLHYLLMEAVIDQDRFFELESQLGN